MTRTDQSFDALWNGALGFIKQYAHKQFAQEDAEDFIQDLRVKLWRAFPDFRPMDAPQKRFNAWAGTALTRLHMDVIRAKRARIDALPLFDELDGFEADTLKNLAVHDDYSHIDSLLDEISDQNIRRLIVLRAEGYNCPELAAIFGVHIRQVYSAFKWARKQVPA